MGNMTQNGCDSAMLDPPKTAPRVLVVDDDAFSRETVVDILRAFGFSVEGFDSGHKALERARQEEFEVAVVDLLMPEISGLETIRRLKEVSPHTEVVVLTGAPSIESSLAAIDERVFAYLCKPAESRALAKTAHSAAEHFRLAQKNRDLLRRLEAERNALRGEVETNRRALERRMVALPEFTGQSPAMERIRQSIALIAPSDLTVLILGESGTGKEVVAQLIGELSGRNHTGGFIKINCPAIPEALLESELFGHEQGAFTGATRRKPGRLELAPNGTVFLDEIGDLPLGLQAKLLQVIESKQFVRVGGTNTITVNTRILAATNAPLEKMVEAGTFRRDLYYRLTEYSIYLPPLREHSEDIPLLVEHFLGSNGSKRGAGTPTRVSEQTMKCLTGYHWPGNVRELKSLVSHFVLTGSEQVFIDHVRRARATAQPQGGGAFLPFSLPNERLPDHLVARGGSAPQPVNGATLRDTEIQAIRSALEQCGWNRRRAAKTLGTSYCTLRRKISLYGLRRSSKCKRSI